MKTLTENKALRYLRELKSDYQNFIRENYEHRAQNCATCPTKGACCLDAHFVNVRITKLEAKAIIKILAALNIEKQREIYAEIEAAVEKYDLRSDDEFSIEKTFACPLFDKNVGCSVHRDGKPAPCISHACYENQADLPPDDTQTKIENKIARLNVRVYGNGWNYLPLPVWLSLLSPLPTNSETENLKSSAVNAAEKLV